MGNEIRALLPSGDDVRAWLGFQKVNGRWTPDNPNYGKISWTNWNRNEGNDGSLNAGIFWQRGYNGKWYDMTPASRKHFAVCSTKASSAPTPAPTEPPTPAPTASPTPAPTASPTSSPTAEASYGNVIEWLRELIAEGQGEIVTVKKKTQDLKDILSDAENALDDALRKEGQAAAAAREAATALANAQGFLPVCEAKYESESKRLDEEIRIFGKVKDILNGLLNGKQLVEQDKADVGAFISLAEEANPDTVNQIIALIVGLVKAAEYEIDKITAERNNCRFRLQVAETKNARAAGVWDASKLAVLVATARKNRIESAYKTQKKYDDERTAVLNGEIAQFEEIINILHPLFE